jgi:pyruvate/2-oxoglutarate dehydrogenase complex dihydrolipoamide acyltransferase (E2) component
VSAKPRDRAIQRLCYSIPEAAEAFGIGEDLFRAEVLPRLARIDVGTRVLLDVEDLRAWVKEHKATASANQEAPAPRTRSGSVSAVGDASSPRARRIAQKLNERLADSTPKSSPENGRVLELASSSSRRGSPRHG